MLYKICKSKKIPDRNNPYRTWEMATWAMHIMTLSGNILRTEIRMRGEKTRATARMMLLDWVMKKDYSKLKVEAGQREEQVEGLRVAPPNE